VDTVQWMRVADAVPMATWLGTPHRGGELAVHPPTGLEIPARREFFGPLKETLVNRLAGAGSLTASVIAFRTRPMRSSGGADPARAADPALGGLGDRLSAERDRRPAGASECGNLGTPSRRAGLD